MTERKAEAKNLLETPKGGHFFTEKDDKTITALAHYYKKKVTTERLLTIHMKEGEPIAGKLTKVTIL
jgi:hypothetical protein